MSISSSHPFVHAARCGILALIATACHGQYCDTGGCTELPAATCSGSTRTAVPGVADAVHSNNDFGLDVYRALAAADETTNVFASPWSVAGALSMTYAGASGTTAEAMSTVLHVGVPSAFHEGEGALMRDLQTGTEDCYTLDVANQLFSQAGYGLDAGFTSVLSDTYGAPIETLDIAADPEAARAHVNGWVGDHTGDQITELFPSGTIGDDTVLILANAVYFHGDWKKAFDPKNTVSRPFHRDTGDVSAPMMQGEFDDARYGHDDALHASLVALPYEGDDIEMVLLLPDDTLAGLEGGLDANSLATAIASAQTQAVSVVLPKFEFRTAYDLIPTLTGLGMGVAFDPGAADFSAMVADPTAQHPVISQVRHSAYVLVDEAGTTAAAATGVSMTDSATMSPSVVFDRPFVFLLRDVVTDQVLFVGHVADPTAS